jgi:uncharacterized protein (DUF433 family)
MRTTIEAQSVPLAIDADGAIRVGGTRVTLDTICAMYENGHSPEVIAAKLPALSLPDVYAAVTYSLRNPESVAEYLKRREAEAAMWEEKLKPFGMVDEVRQRLYGATNGNGSGS